MKTVPNEMPEADTAKKGVTVSPKKVEMDLDQIMDETDGAIAKLDKMDK